MFIDDHNTSVDVKNDNADYIAELVRRNIRVNGIGNSYQIEGLKSKAAYRVEALLRLKENLGAISDVFFDIIEEAQINTGDKQLHDILIDVIARNIAQLTKDRETSPKVMYYEDFLSNPSSVCLKLTGNGMTQ